MHTDTIYRKPIGMKLYLTKTNVTQLKKCMSTLNYHDKFKVKTYTTNPTFVKLERYIVLFISSFVSSAPYPIPAIYYNCDTQYWYITIVFIPQKSSKMWQILVWATIFSNNRKSWTAVGMCHLSWMGGLCHVGWVSGMNEVEIVT